MPIFARSLGMVNPVPSSPHCEGVAVCAESSLVSLARRVLKSVPLLTQPCSTQRCSEMPSASAATVVAGATGSAIAMMRRELQAPDILVKWKFQKKDAHVRELIIYKKYLPFGQLGAKYGTYYEVTFTSERV